MAIGCLIFVKWLFEFKIVRRINFNETKANKGFLFMYNFYKYVPRLKQLVRLLPVDLSRYLVLNSHLFHLISHL